MIIYENLLYNQDIAHVTEIKFPWYKLQNRSIMISGATGLIGSFLIDVLLEKNTQDGLNCTVYALGRNKEKAMERFSKHANNSHLIFIPYDVRLPLKIDNVGRVDYVLHLAANTHPMLYATDPIGTITTNLIGAQNMLEFSAQHNAVRFLLASSNEMYGENRGDVEFYDEDYCGYINCNTLRAGYPESKRCSEALCQAYKQQKGLDVVIARLTRSYGPTMNMSDTKAVSQFIKRGVAGEDIILKSEGTQYFNNRVLGKISETQHFNHGDRFANTAASGGYTVPDFTKIAEAYGIKAVKLNSYEDLENYKEWFYDKEPCLFDISLPEETFLTPKIKFETGMMSPKIDDEVFQRVKETLKK